MQSTSAHTNPHSVCERAHTYLLDGDPLGRVHHQHARQDVLAPRRRRLVRREIVVRCAHSPTSYSQSAVAGSMAVGNMAVYTLSDACTAPKNTVTCNAHTSQHKQWSHLCSCRCAAFDMSALAIMKRALVRPTLR